MKADGRSRVSAFRVLLAAAAGTVVLVGGAVPAAGLVEGAGAGDDAPVHTAVVGESRPAPGRSRDSTRWSWPVTTVRVVGAYSAPPSPYAAGHRGIDLAALPGATVTAPSDATVHFAGIVVDRPVLTLDHGSGVLSSYEPLAATGLVAGGRVARGTVLGVVGEGAHCSGACLHVGVRVDGEYVSPLLFFDRLPRSVLLPLRRDVPAQDARVCPGPRERPVRPADGRSGRSP